jgi:hypothetical protein
MASSVYENPLAGSKVISGRHRHAQVGDLISLLSFLESRLKTDISFCKFKS